MLIPAFSMLIKQGTACEVEGDIKVAMATECPVVFPAGIGVVPWMVPGGREIAVLFEK